MSKYVVFGAGPIGRAIARQWTASGHEVVLASRSGSGPQMPGVTRVAIDAADPDAVARAAEGADALVNALNPAYHRWPTDWPPMAASLLDAAASSGALLITVSNLYGYGPVAGPITEDLPLAATGTKGRVRAQMFQDALRAHREGRVRMVEVRASDYVGPGAESHLGDRVVPRLLAGKSVSVLGSPDQPHTWTYTEDVARLVVALAERPDAWGRAWHVPSNPARTQRQACADLAEVAGVPAPTVRSIPSVALRLLGLVNPTIRELKETRYQFDAPFVMASSAAENELDVRPTPWSAVLADTLRSYGWSAAEAGSSPWGGPSPAQR